VAVDADGHDHGGTVHADITDGQGAGDGAARAGTCAAGGRG
jgi:hypothetical protein